MKKIITLILVSIGITAYCQSDSSKSSISVYSSIGVSIGNMNTVDSMLNAFGKISYPSAEIGITKKSVSVGAILGLTDMQFKNPTAYYELKVSISKPIGECYGYGLFGIGAYATKDFSNFIEYGAGFGYMPKKWGYFVQYSNWAGSDYISVGFNYLLR